jgi:hypothetical protein
VTAGEEKYEDEEGMSREEDRDRAFEVAEAPDDGARDDDGAFVGLMQSIAPEDDASGVGERDAEAEGEEEDQDGVQSMGANSLVIFGAEGAATVQYND